jgi:DNA-binding transcriptional ArsR family regulator
MTTLDAKFAALADPTRRSILAALASGEKTVLELCQPFAMSQPAVSRHLRVLEESGFITRRVEGTKRPCRLARDGLQELDAWLTWMRGALEANYSRLDDLLASEGQKKKKRRRDRR